MLSRHLLAALLLFLGALAAPAPEHQCPAPTSQTDSTITQTNSPSTTSSSASASSPSATSGSTSSSESDKLVRAAWYTPWKANTLPLEKVSWSKYNVMAFAFALTTNEPSVLELDEQSKQLLPDFVTHAKANGVKALLSIGGYSGSKYFSTAVGTPQNRTTFLKAIVDIAAQYKLDGIDFDWEFPNQALLSCNVISKDDTGNFLELLQELKEDERGANLTLTAAVPIKPFLGVDGNPLSDVSAFAQVFDYIAIMAYDVWGPWSKDTGVGLVGPNAPQEDQCSPSPKGSAQSAIDDWTKAGFPVDKIVLGVPSYGRAYSVTPTEAQKLSFADGKLTEYPEFVSIPLGQGEEHGTTSNDPCGAPVPSGNGVFDFRGLISAGYLRSDGNAAKGMHYAFDQCSQTPFLYDSSKQIAISYEDGASFTSKGDFIARKHLKGFATWDAAGDSDDILVDAIIKGMQSNVY